jgi:hypothetical protein
MLAMPVTFADTLTFREATLLTVAQSGKRVDMQAERRPKPLPRADPVNIARSSASRLSIGKLNAE